MRHVQIPLTSLVVQLAENLADDLADRLQRSQIVLRLVIFLLELFDALPQAPDLAVDLLVL